MKKMMKKAFLSVLVAATTMATVAATALMVTTNVNSAAAENVTSRFAMVDGASIRYSQPLGLRFIAELGEQEYTQLKTEESGVVKKMGMFIMPWDYVADENDVIEITDYANVETKLDYVFYASDGSVEDRIYEYEDEQGDTYYRANGVIANLKLKNYAREFVGIGYISRTVGDKTTYTYMDVSKDEQVRSSAYVAIEAYADPDYANNSYALKAFKQYIDGAQLSTNHDVTEVEGVNGEKTYQYGGESFASIQEVKDKIGEYEYSLKLDKTIAYVKEGGTAKLTSIIHDETHDVDFSGAHAVFTSSNEKVVKVDENGVLTHVSNGTATITAKFMDTAPVTCEVISGAITFDDGTLTKYLSAGGRSTVSVADSTFGKALKVTAEMSNEGNARVMMDYALMELFFEDENVEYIAFDIKLPDDATDGTVYYHNATGGWTKYETGGYNASPTTAWETYHFPRSIYEGWLTNGKTGMRFLNVGAGVTQGESYYVDNIRPVTEADYERAWYSFENGDLRTNRTDTTTTPLYYNPNDTQWELSFSNVPQTTMRFTSEIVSDGTSALQFTKNAGETSIGFNANTATEMETAMREAGYISFDLYRPAGSDARIVKNGYYGALKDGWNTIYLKVDATANELFRFTDTTASTYVIDNIRFITENEYYEKAYGFEAGAGILRTAEIGDASTGTGVFYYYGGADMTSTFSLSFNEGGGSGDGNAISNPRYASNIVHSGDWSLAFDKGSGYLSVSMRNDSTAYANLKNGFTFWVYSTVAIDGTTNQFVNGKNAKFNGGDGVKIPANTWTKIIVTADDMNPTRFWIMQGSWSGAIYIDDIEALPTANIATLDANGGTVSSTTLSVYNGYNYKLPIPSSYRDFLGWYDEKGNLVPTSGVWTYGDVTLTAKYANNVSFEDGVVPTYMKTETSMSVVDMPTTDGEKALKITVPSSTAALKVSFAFLESFFADESVDYIAFNARTELTKSNNFRRTTCRSNNGGEFTNVKYEADNDFTGVDQTAFKTFYFSRADYERWIEYNADYQYFISAGNLTAGDSVYVDNIRAVTAEEYTASIYSLETDQWRLDGNNLLFYTYPTSGTWQWCITQGTVLPAYGWTNETVTDGVRAFTFTLTAGVTSTLRFNSATVQLAKELMTTGYYALDLYVPEGADVTLTYQTTTWPGVTPKKGGWTTIYVKNSTNFIKITDTTGSTYAIDNFRSVTAEEYQAAAFGFEAQTGGLRDNVADSNVFYYYADADHTANKYSICGTGTPLESVRLDGEIVHSGDYSLAFTKEDGSLAFQMRKDSNAYALLKHGFTFWIYSTVGLNGVSANNFINGNSQKFGESGMSVSANKWTQVTVTEADIAHSTAADGPCPFLRLNGSTAGTIYIDDIVALPYEAPNHYNATVESDENGVRSGIVLRASTHQGSNQDALPSTADFAEDMSYIHFGDTFGLNDFLVFDFTGDNMPILSFFNTEVTNSVFNATQNSEVKGWVIANGMTTPMRGLTYGGLETVHPNRLSVLGPYKIQAFDATIEGQTRANFGSVADPYGISMRVLQEAGDVPYRMIVGWVENGNYMNLVIRVFDLTTGQIIFTDNVQTNFAKANWEGDIALYGHFGRETYVDALYPIEEDTTIDAVVAKHMPNTIVYNGAWDGDKLTLAASTYEGSPNRPNVGTTDMSYIAFDGDYGVGDYVVFDMTGNNMPILSFFNNEVTNTVFNNASPKSDAAGVADENAHGIVVANGLFNKDGTMFDAGGVNACRLIVVGYQKALAFDDNSNSAAGGFRSTFGSTADVNPLSITALASVTDTYRIIMGFSANGKLDVGAINMVTGAVVYQKTLSVGSAKTLTGSIALHGQFAEATTLDKVFGVEENTTLSALMTKYAKDSDYNDEAAVTLDRYAYSSLSNGQWTLDGENQVANPTDFRELDSTYETYANAGFNIMLAQDMINLDGSKATWNASAARTYMDKAYNAGLKVILTDWHLQITSAPIKVSGNAAPTKSDSTYVPWILKSDVNLDSSGNIVSGKTDAAQKYLDVLDELGITPVFKLGSHTVELKNRDVLDKWVYDQLAVYADHPAFYGVMLADEPSYHNAYCYGEIYKSIKRVMPDCYVQYNLLPLEHSYSTIQYRYPGMVELGETEDNEEIESAYKDYVTRFLDAMGTDYIQYDDYPFKSAEEGSLWWKETVPYVDKTSLRNIQLIAEIAKERDLDVKVVTQSSLMRSNGASGPVRIRQITENDARWLNNYLMGFGVKQINYFTYWTKSSNSSSGEYFVDGGSFVNRDGTTTNVYTWYKTIMAENTAFAPTISHFDYNESQVFGSNNGSQNNDHISWSSSLTKAKTFKWLTNVTTSKEYTLVTELYDEDRYNYMYMVMNTIDPSEGATQSVTITLDSSVTKFYVYDQRGNRTLVSGNSHTVSLTAGQAIYIMPCAW